MSLGVSILIVDCFDSFTYNLAHYLESVPGSQVTVIRVNQVKVESCRNFDAIVLSPGPGLPKDYPVLKEIILSFDKPIFGICLGLQAIVEVFGGKLMNLPEVWHGIARKTFVDTEEDLFRNLPNHFLTGRYHSWVAKSVPEHFKLIARDMDGYIMGISHKYLPIKAVQFHPESVLTEYGKEIMVNWLKTVF